MIRRNSKGITNAKALIEENEIDFESDWEFTAEDGNKLLGPEGDDWDNYSQWFLAEDTEATRNTKDRYKFPFGKDDKVYRSGVIAAKQRAAQSGYGKIESAADSLLKAIDAKKDSCGMKEPMEGEHEEDGCGKKKKMDSVQRIDIMSSAMNCEWGKDDDYMVEKFKKVDGGLMGRAVVTNIGVFSYRMPDGTVRRELRSPEEVFAQDSISSLKLRPLTNDHPMEAVTPENISTLQVGTLGDDVRNDAYRVSASLFVSKADAIEAVMNGKRALSCGYSTDVLDRSGVWMGVPYDAVQTNIRYNHVALVPQGRAGDDAVIRMDGAGVSIQTSYNPKEKDNMKKINLDGVEYEAEAKVIDALTSAQAKLDSNEKEKSSLQAKLDSASEQLEQLKKDVEDAKAIQPSIIEKAIKARVALVEAAKKADVEIKEDSTDLEIKKSIVLKAFPKFAEKSDTVDEVYVDARFDAAMEIMADREEVANKNRQDAGETEAPAKEIKADEARQRYLTELQNKWNQK